MGSDPAGHGRERPLAGWTCIGRAGGGATEWIEARYPTGHPGATRVCTRPAPAVSVTGQGVFFLGERSCRRRLTTNSSSLTAVAVCHQHQQRQEEARYPFLHYFWLQTECFEQAAVSRGRAPPRLKNLVPAGPPPMVSYVPHATMRVQPVCRSCKQVSIRSSPLPTSAPAGDTIPSVTGPQR